MQQPRAVRLRPTLPSSPLPVFSVRASVLSAPVLLALWLSASSLPAWANLDARFVEGAPKDRFEFTNRSACALANAEITVDLRTSPAGLIFDTTSTGAGVEVFQPFELVEGAQALSSHTPVNDGDTQVVLTVRSLAPGARIAFTVDVDDTISQRGITIAGSEIEGATVRLTAGGFNASGRFTAQAETSVGSPPCR